jgi:uncharacterized membrane protein YkoI
VKLKLIIPAGVLLIGGLSACSTAAETPGSDSAKAPAAAGATADQAQGSSGQTQDSDGDGDKKKEEPLAGEIKDKAEAAALAKFPGTVKKSEYDVEKPGHYAVEIEQNKGGTVEVYLDKSYKVVGTKDEKGETDND